MASASCTISGMQAVFANLDASYNAQGQKINAALQGAGILCQAEAKKNCAVDTGRLRSSIQYEAIPFTVTVRTNVSYGVFVEMGTIHMRARPFLFPAFELARIELLKELAAI